jgi:hypothetical protein
MKSKHIMTVLLSLYIVTMVILAVAPNQIIVSLNVFKVDRNVLHTLEFFMLGVLLVLTAYFHKLKHPLIFSSLIALVIAILSEIIQIPTATRHFNWSTYFVDIVGIAWGLAIGKVLTFNWKKK